MVSRDSVEYVQKEHLEIVRLADKIADALALASKEDFQSRQQGLVGLRTLREGLVGVLQHCHAEEGMLESDFHHYLDAQQYGRLRSQHQSIARTTASLLRELPYVTADSVRDLCGPGQELLEEIREHVAYEADMLWCVEGKRLQYQ
jgi:hypothetical protein